jgi:large subunit ribosomal protein L24
MQKIRKGDEVIVIAGKDKGRRGAVMEVLEGGMKLVVDGINMVKKHVKANPNVGEQGGIKTKPKAIDRSNVKIYNATTQKGDRVGIRVLEDGRKVRIYKSSNEEIEV